MNVLVTRSRRLCISPYLEIEETQKIRGVSSSTVHAQMHRRRARCAHVRCGTMDAMTMMVAGPQLRSLMRLLCLSLFIISLSIFINPSWAFEMSKFATRKPHFDKNHFALFASFRATVSCMKSHCFVLLLNGSRSFFKWRLGVVGTSVIFVKCTKTSRFSTNH